MLKVKIPAHLALFFAGALFFLFWFFHQRVRVPLVFGELSWGAAYFWVVADNWNRKAPAMTRGGLVKYEKDPRRFMFAYGCVVALGAGFLFVFLILALFGTR